MKNTDNKAYEAYKAQYQDKLRLIKKYGGSLEDQIILQHNMRTKAEFESEMRAIKLELKKKGKRPSSETKLGVKLANQETKLHSDKQANAILRAYDEAKRVAKEKGIEFNVPRPTKRSLLYGTTKDKFYDPIKDFLDVAEDEAITMNSIFGSK